MLNDRFENYGENLKRFTRQNGMESLRRKNGNMFQLMLKKVGVLFRDEEKSYDNLGYCSWQAHAGSIHSDCGPSTGIHKTAIVNTTKFRSYCDVLYDALE